MLEEGQDLKAYPDYKMATNKFVIKCKTPAGTLTLENLNGDSTVKQLKDSLYEVLNKKPECLKILYGYPPKPLSYGNCDLKLHEANICSGDTLIIEIQKETSESRDEQVLDLGMLPVHSGIMMRHEVKSDNSCLFASIYWVLSSNEQFDMVHNSDLRKIIATVVASDPVKYNDAILGKPNPEYCTWIQDNKTWGGGLELAILSEHFQIEIAVANTMSLAVHRFGESAGYTDRIFLIYDGIHYDPLALDFENEQQSVFSTTDELPVDMAIELAREAKSSKMYTDLANFILICRSCNARLHGEKEATQHAKATGHSEFSELNLK